MLTDSWGGNLEQLTLKSLVDEYMIKYMIIKYCDLDWLLSQTDKGAFITESANHMHSHLQPF